MCKQASATRARRSARVTTEMSSPPVSPRRQTSQSSNLSPPVSPRRPSSNAGSLTRRPSADRERDRGEGGSEHRVKRANLERSRRGARTNKARERTITRLFNKFDSDGKGLTQDQLKSALEYLQLESDSATFNAFFKKFHLNRKDRVTLREFQNVLGDIDKSYQSREAQLRKLFDEFDPKHTGSISRRDLKKLLEALDSKLDESAVRGLLQQFSSSATTADEVTYDEFERWVLQREHEVEERKVFYSLFDKYDIDGDHRLTSAELDLFLKELSPHLRPGERHTLARQLAAKGAGTSHEAFADAVTELQRNREAVEETIAELFDSCDPEGRGYVARKDLPMLLVKLGMKPNENNVEKFLELYDSEGNGKLSFADFRAMASSLLTKSSSTGSNSSAASTNARAVRDMLEKAVQVKNRKDDEILALKAQLERQRANAAELQGKQRLEFEQRHIDTVASYLTAIKQIQAAHDELHVNVVALVERSTSDIAADAAVDTATVPAPVNKTLSEARSSTRTKSSSPNLAKRPKADGAAPPIPLSAPPTSMTATGATTATASDRPAPPLPP